MAAECFVVNKADWDQLMLVFSGMCLLLTVLFMLSLVDWSAVAQILRVYLRGRRIARIRGARNGR